MCMNIVQVYQGSDTSISNMVIGECVALAGEGHKVIIIQFLRSKEALEAFNLLGHLEPVVKMFRFEKYDQAYKDLTQDEREEEKMNILNGFNFAKKVTETGEADVLILDNLLSACEYGIIPLDEMIRLIGLKNDDHRLVLTGETIPKELEQYVDHVIRMEEVKSEEL